MAAASADRAPLLSLDAVIAAVTDGAPRLLVVDAGGSEPPSIPSTRPTEGDVTLERAMRRGISEQTGLDVGYVEQLYTFGDRERRPDEVDMRSVSVAYLALAREVEAPLHGSRWVDWYSLFPWEDHRSGRPGILDVIDEQLAGWATSSERQERVALTFGEPWDGVRVLERYELLYELGAVAEAGADQAMRGTGDPLAFDHRRIAATALGRLRGKFSYRPVVFEMLGETFTLLELQRCVEALAGVPLHKQNFRRLVERSGLVEGTGRRQSKGGRPAELFRYRHEVVLERTRPGLGQPYR